MGLSAASNAGSDIAQASGSQKYSNNPNDMDVLTDRSTVNLVNGEVGHGDVMVAQVEDSVDHQ